MPFPLFPRRLPAMPTDRILQSMRVTERRHRDQTLVASNDWQRALPVAVLWAVLLGQTPVSPWVILVSAALVPAAFGVGFRVVIGRDEIQLAKTWMGVPYRRRRYALEADVRLYDAPDGSSPAGVVLVDPGEPELEGDVFGSSATCREIQDILRAAIERHRRLHTGVYR